jgi:hypothetical protein
MVLLKCVPVEEVTSQLIQLGMKMAENVMAVAVAKATSAAL